MADGGQVVDVALAACRQEVRAPADGVCYNSSQAMKDYLVIYEHSETGWSAYVPDLPGCVAAGDTREEVATLIKEAIEFHIEGLREQGLSVPEPTADAERVRVAA